MHSSSCASKHVVLVHILAVVAIQLVLIRSVSSLNMTNAYLHHTCYVSQGKYKAGSDYDYYINKIIQSIPRSSNFSNGFEMEAYGEGPSYVSATLQCRGDSYGPRCHSCFATAVSGLRRRCPNHKGGIIWYDQCFLEFSAINKSDRVDYDNNICMANAKKVSRNLEDSFDQTWMALVDNLTSIAIQKKNRDLTLFYAAGERKLGTKTIYAMVMCTKDITDKGCRECVGHNVVHFYKCCEIKQGARVLGRSCSFRFELYPFVNTKSEIKYLET